MRGRGAGKQEIKAPENRISWQPILLELNWSIRKPFDIVLINSLRNSEKHEIFPENHFYRIFCSDVLYGLILTRNLWNSVKRLTREGGEGERNKTRWFFQANRLNRKSTQDWHDNSVNFETENPNHWNYHEKIEFSKFRTMFIEWQMGAKNLRKNYSCCSV